MRLPMHVIFAAASLCFVASHARALPLAAGRGVTVDSEDPPFVMPPGTKLAEKTIPFTVTYPIPAGREAAGDTTADATLVSSVYRHADTGRLFFVYALDVEDILFFPPDRFGQPTRELSQLTVAGFTGSATDVTGDTSPGASFQVSRSADGSTLTTFTGEGLGGPPLLVVQTDATAYDALGRARARAAPAVQIPAVKMGPESSSPKPGRCSPTHREGTCKRRTALDPETTSKVCRGHTRLGMMSSSRIPRYSATSRARTHPDSVQQPAGGLVTT